MSGEQQARFEMLNDISKVAAIKATSALSKILEFPLGVDITPVAEKRLDEIKTAMEPQEKVVGLSVPIIGALQGTCLLIYPENVALLICDTMFHRKEGETKQFGEIEISALTEVANIVIGNFLTSFAGPLQIKSLLHRAVDFKHNTFSTFIEEITLALADTIKKGFIVEIVFYFQHIKIHGTAIFLFDEKMIVDALYKMNL